MKPLDHEADTKAEPAARRLNVWVVTPELHRHGGTERCIAEQVERWRTRFDLRVYTMKAEGVDLSGVDLRRIPWIPGPHLVRYIWWFGANSLARWYARLTGPGPDLVYSPGINCSDASAMSVHIVFAKQWEQVHSSFKLDLRRRATFAKAVHRLLYWRLLRWLEGWIYSGPATIWALSGPDAQRTELVSARPAGSVPVEPYGVDTARFSPDERARRGPAARRRLGAIGARTCLLIGNDAYTKGVDTAIVALAGLPSDVHLAVAGKVDKGPIVGWATARGVLDRVHLWPHTSDVLEYFAAADVVLAPSRQDAFNMPALEALACGMPLVVSGRAGIADLLEDGKHALILANPEDPNELCLVLKRVLDDQSLAASLAVNGRALAEQWSWDSNADRAAALLHREVETPRLLVLAPDPWGMGGVQRMTRTLLSSLADLYGGERVGLLQLWDHGVEPHSCRLLHSGVASAGKATGRVTFARRIGFLLAAIRHARRWNRNLVLVAAHAHLAPVAWIAAVISGRPYAVWCHGLEVWGPLRFGVRHALRNAAAIFTTNRFTATRVEQLAALPAGSVRVFPYGLPADYTIPAGSTSAGSTVLTVARLAPEDAYKGVDALICAWPQVLAGVPGAELRIVGDGDDRPRLVRLVETLGVSGSVCFAGRQEGEELKRAYAEAAVFAMPGRHSMGRRPEGEGFGLVFLEAGAAGLPVVGGRAGGTEDAIDHLKSGLLVDPHDPVDIANAIVTLLRDRELARKMGEQGRLRAAGKFSYAAFTKSIGDLVGSLASLEEGPTCAASSAL
ncbi:MAG TPA: glycosyltransferase family 4 protein [Candidatus Dormibacteraeota bacterium]|nr:glycosyltransferase family 4 protein [Candidatus Dormibacteraeota bacterium]